MEGSMWVIVKSSTKVAGQEQSDLCPPS